MENGVCFAILARFPKSFETQKIKRFFSSTGLNKSGTESKGKNYDFDGGFSFQ